MSTAYTTDNLNALAGDRASVMVITDAPGAGAWDSGKPMSGIQMKTFGEYAKANGFDAEDFTFINPCPPVPEWADASDRKLREYLDQYRGEFEALVDELSPGIKCVLYLGKTAGMQLLQKGCKITTERGSFKTHAMGPRELPMLPLFSMAMILQRVETRKIYESDFRQLTALRKHKWRPEAIHAGKADLDYSWCYDLSALIALRPRFLSVDVETKGLNWWEGARILTVQFCWEPGKAVAVPLDCDYDPSLTPENRLLLVDQVKTLLGNRATRVVGHNFKFDIHHLLEIGVRVANWRDDTLQMAFAVDENMQVKSLDECVRRWLPELSGYADAFNARTDKSRMDAVPMDDMLDYGCGDVDAVLRLHKVLLAELERDERQLNLYRRVQMPALNMFVGAEHAGVRVDSAELTAFTGVVNLREQELCKRLIAHTPAKVLRKHAEKGCRFSRDEFVADVLFSEDGFGLTPVVFTDSTKYLPEDQRIPSASAKTHFPFFEELAVWKDGKGKLRHHKSRRDDTPEDAFDYIVELMEYQKLVKMISTYVGERGGVEYAEILPLKDGSPPKVVKEKLEERRVVKHGHWMVKGPDSDTGEVRLICRGEVMDTGEGEADAKLFAKWIRQWYRDGVVPDEYERRMPFASNDPSPEVAVTWPLKTDTGGNPVVELCAAYDGRLFRRTYSPDTGFWKYMDSSGRIHANYSLWTTVTGRTSCCVHADTLVSAKRGLVRIADITEGDFVWSHAGKWRRVLRGVMKPPCEMYDVRLSNGEILRCTKGHKLLFREGWGMLGDALSIKETYEGFSLGCRRSRKVSHHEYDRRGASSVILGEQCHGAGYDCATYDGRSILAVEASKVSELEIRGQEPTKGNDSGKTGVWGWARLPYEAGRGEEILCAPYCHGESLGAASGRFAGMGACSSYRRESEKQCTGQSGPGDQSGASGNPCKVSAGYRVIEIEEIHFAGVYPVYDIEVEIDHSYLAAGVFNHNTSPNIQNIPKHGKLAESYRRIFISTDGWEFVSADLSQAELRIAAWMANEANMLKVYREGGDVHAATAAFTVGMGYAAFMRMAEEDPKKFKRLRQGAKATNFGYLYGMWWTKFKGYAKVTYGVNLSDAEAKASREKFFALYPGFLRWHDNMRKFCEKHDYVRALHGALRRLPSIHSSDESVQRECGRQAINAPIQRFASDLALTGLIRFSRDCDERKMRPSLFIHDDSTIEARKSVLGEAASALKWYMQSPPIEKWFGIKSPIPILSDVSIGRSLGAMREATEIKAVRPKWARPD